MFEKEFSFELITQDKKARLGKIKTQRDLIQSKRHMKWRKHVQVPEWKTI